MKVSILTFIVTCLISCQQEYEYIDVRNVTDHWSQDKGFSFDINSNLQGPSAIDLILTHTDEYAYQNIYLKLISLRDRDTLAVDIKSLELTDGAGLWIGDRQGNNWTIQDSISLSKSLTQLIVFPYGREAQIDNITEFGIGIR